MCISTYIYRCVYVYIYIYTCVWLVYICMCIYMCIYMYAYICMCIRSCFAQVCMHCNSLTALTSSCLAAMPPQQSRPGTATPTVFANVQHWASISLASVGRAEKRVMAKTLEAAKSLMWSAFMTLVQLANGSPVLQTFSCDCTPLRLPHRIQVTVSDQKRAKTSRKTTELLVMSRFIRSKDANGLMHSHLATYGIA